jgi:hypothetical protein
MQPTSGGSSLRSWNMALLSWAIPIQEKLLLLKAIVRLKIKIKKQVLTKQ